MRLWETRAFALLIGIGAAVGIVVGYWTFEGTGDE